MTGRAGKGPAPARKPKGSRLFRWQGLLVFFALCALAAGFWLLFVNRVTERAIERAGTAAVGAKVELDKADVSISPLGVTLLGLKVTDPGAPMTNAFEVGRIAFLMDGPNALRRKVIIEEMSIEGVRLNTPRTTSGAVARTQGRTPLERLAELPSFVIPNVKEAFEKEKADLQSLRLLTGAAADAGAMRTRWDGKLEELKAAADAGRYQKRYEELRAKAGKVSIGGLVGGAKDVVALQKEVRADIQTVAEAKKAFTADLAALKKAASDAPDAVRDDARRMVEKYSLTPSGLSNISRMLFGAKISASVRSALQWNERLSPFIERVKEQVKGREVVKPLRAKGRNVRFREDRPLPDFLARLAKVSVSLPQGAFAGRIDNLTSEQDVLGRPLEFSFSAEKLKGLRSVALEGMFDRVDPAARKDALSLKLLGYEARGVKLVESASLPLSLREGLADLDVRATLEKGALSARITAGVRSARFEFEGAEARPGLAGRVDEAIRGALAGVTSLHLTAEVSGTPESFDLKLRSDVDEVLMAAVGALVREQMAGFEKDIREAIAKEAAGPLEKLNLGLEGLEAIGVELDSLNKRLADLLAKWK